MRETKAIECDDGPANATGTYFGVPQKQGQQLKIDDIAQLLCDGVTILVKVIGIEDEDITGTILDFENSDAESINGVTCEDDVRFKRNKVQGWHRP